VGRLVLENLRQGKRPRDLTADDLRDFPPECLALLDPRKGIESRELPGGTGPRAVADALETARKRLAGMRG